MLLLPQSSLRTEAVIETTTRLGPPRRTRLSIVRIQGPRRLRTLLTVREQGGTAHIERIVFEEGELRRSLFRPGAKSLHISKTISRTSRIGETEFSYGDLAFADYALRKDGTVDHPAARPSSVWIASSGPGKFDRIVTKLSETTALPYEVTFFGPSGRLLRSLTFSDFDREGVFTFPMRMRVQNFETGRVSILKFSETVVGPPIYEHEFGEVAIERKLESLDDELVPGLLF